MPFEILEQVLTWVPKKISQFWKSVFIQHSYTVSVFLFFNVRKIISVLSDLIEFSVNMPIEKLQQIDVGIVWYFVSFDSDTLRDKDKCNPTDKITLRLKLRVRIYVCDFHFLWSQLAWSDKKWQLSNRNRMAKNLTKNYYFSANQIAADKFCQSSLVHYWEIAKSMNKIIFGWKKF